MKRLTLLACLLLGSCSLQAKPALFICSSDKNALYVMVDDAYFTLFNDGGVYLAGGRFTEGATDNGDPFWMAMVGTSSIGIARVSATAIVLAVIDADGNKVLMECR